MKNMIIRKETENDYRAVEELTREAFWNLYVPGCSEHFCLHNMRDHRDFISELDLVAEREGKVIGNIVYTRGRIIDNTEKTHEVICFGPLSVLPAYQKQGIGSVLIRHSLDKARSKGFNAVCIYGDPRYYARFGFRCAEKYDIRNSEGKFAVALMALELVPGALLGISGRFTESAAFKVDENDFQKYEGSFPPRDKAVTESQAIFKILASLAY
jgi:putative acetyltransferase